MKPKVIAIIGSIMLILAIATTAALASSENAKRTTLVDTVRKAIAQYKDVKAAEAAGYGLFHGCTSGPQGGSMGIHYANGAIVGDGEIDAMKPEVLLYEPKDGKMQLVGVEYVVPADAWNAKHEAPPVLMGQLFNFLGAPNRYGLPAIYELHVWAMKNNPDGAFADWNPTVSCEDFAGTSGAHEGSH